MNKNVLAVFLFLLAGGCSLSNSYYSSNAWHAADMASFLPMHYPVGSDEKNLIGDFKKHGYNYSARDTHQPAEPKTQAGQPLIPAPRSTAQSLWVPQSCSLFFGSRHGINVTWHTDAGGKILDIQFNEFGACLYTP